jgi:hypothetical protein
MENVEISGKRRMQIFVTGLLPLISLCAILGMASAYEFDLVTVFTKVERRDAANYVIVTKVLGVPISSRPATKADLREDDVLITTVKIVVLCVSGAVVSMALAMCFVSITGRPKKILQWFDRKLGSVQWSGQRQR